MPGDAELRGRRRAAAGPAPAAVAGRTPPAGGPGPTPEGAPRQRRSGAGGRPLVRLALVGGAVALVATGAARTDFSQPLVSTAAPVLALGAVAVALALLAALWATPWRRAAALFTLLVAGQAAALQLIDAPRYAAYQHVLPLARLLGAAALPCAVVLLQAAACLVLALRWWRPPATCATPPSTAPPADRRPWSRRSPANVHSPAGSWPSASAWASHGPTRNRRRPPRPRRIAASRNG